MAICRFIPLRWTRFHSSGRVVGWGEFLTAPLRWSRTDFVSPPLDTPELASSLRHSGIGMAELYRLVRHLPFVQTRALPLRETATG